ncbi:MAG: YerC/YecD family TrpR-related protein [Acutalibacteraceae bacterium]|jgi:TrpR-related protein YerC/YecD|nr:YerC/YecD family TrpR-related protein [Acutalibacteraceae bacterium]
MANWHNESTDKLCEALLSLQTKEECYEFLDDVCTIKEVLDISQRLAVALLLAKKTSYNVISQETGASTATISRVSKCYEYGTGGYKKIIEKLGEDRK